MTTDEVVARDHATLDRIARDHLGRGLTRAEPMAAGLGTRRFHRLHFADNGGPATLVARIEDDGARPTPATDWPDPPPWLSEPALEPLLGFLAEAGLPVPASALHLGAEGIDLLEDVGETNLLVVPEDARRARTLEACALLPRLQALEAEARTIPAFGRTYDATLIATKAWKFLHWTVPMLLGRPASAAEQSEIGALFDAITSLATAAPKRLAHRDYKAENLHLVPDAEASARLVMIDVQGAFLAPPEYDLACLLYDLQVTNDEAFVEEALAATRETLPDRPDEETFRTRFDALALARLCKDVAHVVHAGVARGDRRRWHEIPRGLALISTVVGRREHTLPGLTKLASVTAALTAALESSDSGNRGATGAPSA